MKKMITAGLCVLSMSLAYSAQAKSQDFPQSCPSVSEIVTSAQNMKVQFIKEDNAWVMYGNNTFNTPAALRWTILFGPVEAADEVEARLKLIASVSRLNFSQGPIYERESPFVECKYAGGNGLIGIGFWPSQLPDDMIKRLKR